MEVQLAGKTDCPELHACVFLKVGWSSQTLSRVRPARPGLMSSYPICMPERFSMNGGAALAGLSSSRDVARGRAPGRDLA